MIDIKVTNKCNMSCSYCIHKHDSSDHYDIDATLSFINRLNRPMEIITLWGGEPTCAPEVVKEIVRFVKQRPKYRIKLYTNGLDVDTIVDLFYKYRDITEVQMSYDAIESAHGHSQQKTVGDNVVTLDSMGFKVVLKPTISWNDVGRLYEMYMLYKSVDKRVSFDVSCNVSLDYYNVPLAQDVPKIKNELSKQMAMIIKDKKESTHNIKHRLFTKNRPSCHAGNYLIGIDVDGCVYPCHGAMNLTDKSQHKMGHVSQPAELLVYKTAEYSKFNREVPDECLSCNSICYNPCRVARFESSTKSGYFAKWCDMTSDPILCDLFRHISNCVNTYTKELL